MREDEKVKMRIWCNIRMWGWMRLELDEKARQEKSGGGYGLW